MNIETYEIYQGDGQITAAKERGEPLIELSAELAQKLLVLNHEERREEFRRSVQPAAHGRFRPEASIADTGKIARILRDASEATE